MYFHSDTYFYCVHVSQCSLDPIVRAISFLFVPWYIAAMLGPIVYVLLGVYAMVARNYCNLCSKILKSSVS